MSEEYDWLDENYSQPEEPEPRTIFGAFQFFSVRAHFNPNKDKNGNPASIVIPAKREMLLGQDHEIRYWSLGGEKHVLLQMWLVEIRGKEPRVFSKPLPLSHKKYPEILNAFKKVFGETGIPYGKRLELEVLEYQGRPDKDGKTWAEYFIPVRAFATKAERVAASEAFWDAKKAARGEPVVTVEEALARTGIQIPAQWAGDPGWYTNSDGGLPALMVALSQIIGESPTITPPLRAKLATLETNYAVTAAEAEAIWGLRDAYNAVPKF